jgi:Lrp/AsnC family transcriptional regulator, regulator for asnA, asnC and gidA
MKDLEPIDIKILRELLKDGRKSFTAIAKECQTSDDIIGDRFKELEKAGIIVGATIQFNFKKLGYSGVASTMINVESQDLEDTLGRISKIPDIRSVSVLYNSPFNISAVFTLKDLGDLERVKQVVCRQNRINAIRTYIWTDVKNMVENIFGDSTEKNNHKTPVKNPQLNNQENMNIDEIDTKIINLLSENGRLAFSKIAQQVGASTATVARKYERLRNHNLIKVSIQINPKQLGYQSILTVNLLLSDPNEMNETVEKLSKIPGVTYILKISGVFDISFVALVKDCKSIFEINDQILKIPHIKGIEANLRLLPDAWPTQRQYITTF